MKSSYSQLHIREDYVPFQSHDTMLMAYRWRRVVNCRPRSLYLQQEPRSPLSRRLGGPQSRCGRFWRRGNLLPLAGFETRTVQSLYRRRNKLKFVRVQRRRCHGVFWMINVHMVVPCVSVRQLCSERWQQPTNQHGVVKPEKVNHSFQRRVMLYHIYFGDRKKYADFQAEEDTNAVSPHFTTIRSTIFCSYEFWQDRLRTYVRTYDTTLRSDRVIFVAVEKHYIF